MQETRLERIKRVAHQAMVLAVLLLLVVAAIGGATVLGGAGAFAVMHITGTHYPLLFAAVVIASFFGGVWLASIPVNHDYFVDTVLLPLIGYIPGKRVEANDEDDASQARRETSADVLAGPCISSGCSNVMNP